VRTRIVFFMLFSLAVSLGCMRLGFWQLERLRSRRAQNAQVLARLAEAPVPLEHLPRNSTVRFRRVTTTGTYDFANEFVLTTRTRNGAPGVHIITPLRRPGTDTAVLVNRGWAYTPDGMTVDLNVFREDSTAIIDGFVEDFSLALGAVSTASVERALRRLDRDSISARLPYPLAAVVLIQQKDSGEFTAVDRGTPVRVQPPRLDEGSHRSYAIQWFGFAVVGIAGSLVVLQRDRKRLSEQGHQTQLPR
jgi:surfeit locus 1 family protein